MRVLCGRDRNRDHVFLYQDGGWVEVAQTQNVLEEPPDAAEEVLMSHPEDRLTPEVRVRQRIAMVTQFLTALRVLGVQRLVFRLTIEAGQFTVQTLTQGMAQNNSALRTSYYLDNKLGLVYRVLRDTDQIVGTWYWNIENDSLTRREEATNE